MIVWFAGALATAAPLSIEHQARLVDASGAPIDGSVVMQLRLYPSATSTTSLWSNSYTTNATEGYVNVVLSNGTPALSTTLFEQPELWLETQVGATVLGPRERLHSAPYAIRSEIAERVAVASGAPTGTCTDGAVALDPTTKALRICQGSTWVVVTTGPTAAPVGTSTNPATSCQQIRDQIPTAVDATYWIDPDGAGTVPAMPVWCDMFGTEGWALVYLMCQDSTGSMQTINHALPITPTITPDPASITYGTVAAMAPTLMRFTSDFTGGAGYIFPWSKVTAGNNFVETLLNGTYRAVNTCDTLGTPSAGSTGVSCSVKFEHNNAGAEPHDIPTLGCSCHVWDSDGMLWGQIDSLSNYNGVSHLATTGWDHSPQTATGCIQAYVR